MLLSKSCVVAACAPPVSGWRWPPLLVGAGDRHITAEQLHAEAVTAHVRVSLATVYNTLNQFTRAGLLREVAIEGDRTYFDTNTSKPLPLLSRSRGRLFDY
jgi:Fur family iron response transcriptional regulator